MKIIIVDDELHALQLFLSDLIGLDIEYRFFKDDKNAILKYVVYENPDGVFLDVNMPGINGIDLASELIAIKPSIKIVFATGLNISENALPNDVAVNTVGFLYKPYDKDKLYYYLSEIANKTRKMTVKTFGSFDCFIDDRIVRFSSAKSKELFALLIAYRGKTLTMNDAISQIWPDTDVDKSKILYRDAVWRLRKTLSELHFDCVDFRRACLVLNKSNLICDSWDYAEGKNKNYNGEFMKNYDWSIAYLPILDKLNSNTDTTT